MTATTPPRALALFPPSIKRNLSERMRPILITLPIN